MIAWPSTVVMSKSGARSPTREPTFICGADAVKVGSGGAASRVGGGAGVVVASAVADRTGPVVDEADRAGVDEGVDVEVVSAGAGVDPDALPHAIASKKARDGTT